MMFLIEAANAESEQLSQMVPGTVASKLEGLVELV